MTRGHEPILPQQLLEDLEQDEHDLERMEIPDSARAVIQERLRTALSLAEQIDEAQRTASYVMRTGRMPGRVERAERGQRERAA